MARRAKPAVEPVASLAPPSSSEQRAAVPVPQLGLEAREAELAIALAGLRDAEETLVRTRGQLAAREAAIAECEARLLEEKQRVADAAAELDRDRRMLGVREEELAARDAAHRTETAKARMHQNGLEAARAALEATARSLAERESALAEAEAALAATAGVAARQSINLDVKKRQARLAGEPTRSRAELPSSKAGSGRWLSWKNVKRSSA